MESTGATIIVVEDEPGTRTILCGILMEDARYKVIGLERGAEALEMIRKSPFDVIITDIRLPDVSGLEILELAKEINPDAAVIMMTGYASMETAVDAVNQGAYAYFVKPVNPDELKTAIANALKQQRLSLENKRLVESLQHTNQLLLVANEELRNEITERKRMEDTLRESEEKYRTLFGGANDAILLADIETGCILDANKEAERLLGRSRKEIKNMNRSQLHPPDKTEYYEEHFKKHIEAGHIVDFDAEVIRKDGAIVPVCISASVIQLHNRKLIQGIFHDITERKQMERELQERNERLDTQNEELQSQAEELMTQQQELIEKTAEVVRANQLKSEFLANMSHELRTPLNVIIGFSQLMADEVPGQINEEQRQCLNDVLTSSRHLLNLINEVLDLSKIESGKVELKSENVALAGVIASLTRTMMPILTPRKQSLDIKIEEGLPLVYTDERKLGQVLLNLVDNSSKCTPDGGKLKIEAAKEGDWCRISVIDNGIGIKKEDQERIFEPFCQLDNPLVKEKRGTGLGLALVKQIVEKCGGIIWVESKYGKGSHFTFTLPLATSNKQNPE